ncbi:hypothetical protein KAR91_20035 [Candidatus Pacearchaeota archaeon]|nr:hypothetical protein [Candidatus Pacearchaeota archaeon]
MSKENSIRRSRAFQKIQKSNHVDREIVDAIQTILGLLNPKSGFNVAWPSAMAIAKALKNKSRRTGLRHVKIIKALGIFTIIQLPPIDAVAYCEREYGFRPSLDRCIKYGPNLFIVNPSHPLWNNERILSDNVDLSMGEIVRKIKKERNKKTTSRLASNPANRPKETKNSDTKNPKIVTREMREKPQYSDTNDTIDSDTNVTQKVKLSFSVAKAPPKASLPAIAKPSVMLSPKGSPLGDPVHGCNRERYTPPTHHFIHDEIPGDVLNQDDIELLEARDLTASAGSGGRAAAVAASPCRNIIPVDQRGELTDLFVPAFKRNGVPVIDSFQYQKPGLRRLELAGRGRLG